MPWYVVQTKPSQEKKVIFYLTQKGITTYAPETETYVYKGLKKHRKIKSLFPSYIFAQCESNKVYTLCWTKGVKKVLWKNTQPEPVPDELVQALRSLAHQDGLIKPQKFKKHDLVTIKSGPFKDIQALFDHWDSDSERVCLLLKMVNAQMRVTVPASLVEIAG
jgi:transcription antitermination factor NusG